MESLCKKLEKMSREFADSEEMVKRLSTENSQVNLSAFSMFHF